MKSTHLMNSLLFDAWKKAGLSEAEAKKAAMESARSDVALSMVNQSLTELRAHVDTSNAALQAQIEKTHTHIEKTARNNLVVIVTTIGVAVAILAFLLR